MCRDAALPLDTSISQDLLVISATTMFSPCSSLDVFDEGLVRVAKLSWLPNIVLDLNWKLGSNFIRTSTVYPN